MLRVRALCRGLRKGVIRMVVKDIMSSHVRTVLPDDPAELAAEIMRTENVGIVPVCDSQSHLLGLITDRDLIVRKGFGQTAEAVMSGDPVTISPRQDIHEAALQFSACGVRRLPVVDGERLVGMLSLRDLARKKIFIAEIGHIIYHISNFGES